MNHFAVEHLVQDRIAERHAAARRHQRIRTVRRSRHRSAAAAPQPVARSGDLEVDLAALGFAAVEADIARFVRQAQTQGASSTLIAVLIDRQAPVVARERAFARLAASLRAEAPARRVAA